MAAVRDPIAELRAAVAAASAELRGERDGAEPPTLERPPRPEFGDLSTNAALLAAPGLGEPPREVAGRLGERLAERLGDGLERWEVAGPGFLNLFLADAWYRAAVAAILEAGDRFGSGTAADRSQRILLEFVSANPTGPLTVASGRHAAFGDSLGRILAFAGHSLEREYYLNDTGGQVRLFGESISARMRGGEVPEGGYEGSYVAELGERLEAEGVAPTDIDRLARRGVELMRESIAATLERARVSFDRWGSERELHERGAIEEAIEALRERGFVYDSDGAVWLRTSALGDDKDRVLVRASGEPTYFAADAAYHRDKLERGWELMIDVLGADHHGYVPRMRAAVEALGAARDAYEAPIMQLVNLVEGGERLQMSKRRGEFATLAELLDDIGVDAARFFLVQRSHETPIDLDLDVARKRSNENPVYYVQYAHARICSLFRTAAERGGGSGEGAGRGAAEPAERALIGLLLEFPRAVERAELKREPHGIAGYARDVAAGFHAFYRDCRVVGAPGGLEASRLAVCRAAATVIASALGLLGIEAPEEM
jgi:arginyl-tRNA synthetase